MNPFGCYLLEIQLFHACMYYTRATCELFRPKVLGHFMPAFSRRRLPTYFWAAIAARRLLEFCEKVLYPRCSVSFASSPALSPSK